MSWPMYFGQVPPRPHLGTPVSYWYDITADVMRQRCPHEGCWCHAKRNTD